MKQGKLSRRLLALLLALAVMLPLTGPGVVMEASAVTRAEIDALKNKSNTLANQKKDIQAQLKEIQAQIQERRYEEKGAAGEPD